ncbi:hypothetical protein GCM10010191_48330 [Actinomadura vinacea]|uniref:Single-stranded DNA-binding protein n=1 Tax=Actinomadura vinacea TaxID=115336 RepID=A0ABP5WQ71_9ACTN
MLNDYVEVRGRIGSAEIRTFRDVRAGNTKVAFVIDDRINSDAQLGETT